MFPTNYIQTTSLAIRPGDHVVARVTYQTSDASYALTVHDNSTGQHFKQLAHCDPSLTGARASADWIVERPTVGSSYTPLADWGSMQLRVDKAAVADAVVNGKVTSKPLYEPVSAFTDYAIDMVNDPYTGRYLATVGSLGAAGTVFGDTWDAVE